MKNMTQMKLGIITTAKTLSEAIKKWGPVPHSNNICAVYLSDQKRNIESAQEIQQYFGAVFFHNMHDFCNVKGLDFIIDITDETHASVDCSAISGKAAVLSGKEALLLWQYINSFEQESFQREILLQSLRSTIEGIEIADADGNIIFINESMLNMIHVNQADRLWKNVEDVSPDGGMSHVLKTKKPVKNLRNHPQGTTTEFISNAAPIYINGTLSGAVTIANDITEVQQLTKALQKRQEICTMLEKKVVYLASTKYTFSDVIGHSKQMQEIIEVARKAAPGNLSVLIQGESGTGKEIFAHSIHNASNRQSKPFVPVNCAAIPAQLMESEFFGHEKGAFTSAVARKPGLFDIANGGTLFLDEIGDMELSLQSKLLRVLQDHAYRRVGGTKPIHTDVRIIAATNQNLHELAANGRFREDLYYRLSVINLILPPLRERLEDIQDISLYFFKQTAERKGIHPFELSDKALSKLKEYTWPGNIRELENILERAMFLCRGNKIKAQDIYLPEHSAGKTVRENSEKDKIIKYLQLYGWSVNGKKEAAKQMNISLATLYNKIKLYNLTHFYAHTSHC